jgi:hypothetical protein
MILEDLPQSDEANRTGIRELLGYVAKNDRYVGRRAAEMLKDKKLAPPKTQ